MTETTASVGTEEGAFTREAIEHLSRRNGEPQWLATKRLRSWLIYQDMPWETAGSSPQIPKRFDQKELHLEELRLHAANPTENAAKELVLAAQTVSTSFEHRSGLLVQNNSVPIHRETMEELKSQGVIFTDMRTAVREHADILERYLMTEAVHLNDNKLTALHGAFWNGGTFLYVPKGVKIQFPLQSFYLIDGERTAYFPHTLIVAEQNSQVVFIDSHASRDLGGHAFVDGAVEIFTGEGSKVQYIGLQEYGRSVHQYAMKRTALKKGSSFLSCEVSLGGSICRNNIEAMLDEAGTFVELLGLYFPSGEQRMEFNTLQNHAAPHATSDLLYKGALNGNARTVFEGLIRVHPGAQKTNAYQANRNMLLSKGSRADSIPQLEIEANDVRCTHGATVGPISEDELFYLLSRGIPREEAVRLLVLGFFSEVIDRIPVQDIREGLYHHIEKQIA